MENFIYRLFRLQLSQNAEEGEGKPPQPTLQMSMTKVMQATSLPNLREQPGQLKGNDEFGAW